jgi:hypothetical protein
MHFKQYFDEDRMRRRGGGRVLRLRLRLLEYSLLRGA